MNFWNSRAEESKTEAERFGYTLSEPCGDFDTKRGAICLIKAVLMFSASLGTVGSIVSAFGMNVNYPAIVLALLAMSLFLSFLHYNHALFNVGYPVVFVVFAFSIFQNRKYVNSGYQAIVNLIREDYREFFDLKYSGEAYEAVEDRYTTMTFAFLYLGFFLIVLLNIAISTYMSIFLTMLFTFPFLQFGLYIGKRPSFLFVVLLIFVYTAVLLLKRSGHYSISERKKKDKAFQVRKNVYSYKGHGVAMGELVGLVLVLTLVFSLLTYPAMIGTLPGADQTSALKGATDQTIQKLVQGGFSSLFNRYEATGGISGGKLGGVNRVSADYETDLEVTFVPTSMETVYLKAFTGGNYTGSQWETPDYDEGWVAEEEYREGYELLTAGVEARQLAIFTREDGNHAESGKMKIQNVGADENYLYLPYYAGTSMIPGSYVDHSIVYGNSPLRQSCTLTYYPYTQDLDAVMAWRAEGEGMSPAESRFFQTYEELCKEAYTELSPELQPLLTEVMETIGKGDTPEETVERIQKFFLEQYEYSLNPGATPIGKDFATYFLQVQKKGYCAHFATAGTLLCRACGIPARYVEGYVIQATDLADARAEDNQALEDWFSGSAEISRTGVVTVEVPDANAHAWTEIYVDGFGWMPVDFTPPGEAVDEAEEYNSFLRLFAGLFSVQGDNVSSGAISAENVAVERADTTADNSFFLIPVAILLLLIAFVPLGIKLIRFLRRWLRRTFAYRAGRFDEVLPYHYQKMCKQLVKRRKGETLPSLPQEVFSLLILLYPDREEDSKKASVIFEAGLYGRAPLRKEDADFFIRYAKDMVRILRRKGEKLNL